MMSTTARQRLETPLRVLGLIAVTAAATVVGAGLAAVAARFGEFGPLVLLGLVLVPLVLIAAFRDMRIAPILVFATFPLGARGIEALPLQLNLSEVAIILIAAIVVLGRLSGGQAPLTWAPQLWWVVALFMWTLLLLPSAIDQQLSIKQSAQLAGGALFIATVLAVVQKARDVKVILAGGVAVAAVVSLIALSGGQQMEAQLGGARVSGRLEGAFTSANQLGAFCALFLMCAIGLALGSRSRVGRRASYVAIAILFGGLALSLSRGAWLGTALAIAYLAVALPRARRAALAVGLPLAAAAAIISSSLPAQPQVQVVQRRLEALTVRSPYDDRTDIWNEAIREIREEPVLGQGPGGFSVASARSASEASTSFAVHAHNFLLNWAAESGIPGALLLLSFIASLAVVSRRAARAALRQGDERERCVIAGLTAALLSVIGQGIVDYPWGNSVVFLSISAVIALLIASLYRREAVDEADADADDDE